MHGFAEMAFPHRPSKQYVLVFITGVLSGLSTEEIYASCTRSIFRVQKRPCRKFLYSFVFFIFILTPIVAYFIALVKPGTASRRYTNLLPLIYSVTCLSHFDTTSNLPSSPPKSVIRTSPSRSSIPLENLPEEPGTPPRPSTPKANKEPVVVSDMDAGPAGSTRRACVHRNKSVYERKRRAALVSE